MKLKIFINWLYKNINECNIDIENNKTKDDKYIYLLLKEILNLLIESKEK